MVFSCRWTTETCLPLTICVLKWSDITDDWLMSTRFRFLHFSHVHKFNHITEFTLFSKFIDLCSPGNLFGFNDMFKVWNTILPIPAVHIHSKSGKNLPRSTLITIWMIFWDAQLCWRMFQNVKSNSKGNYRFDVLGWSIMPRVVLKFLTGAHWIHHVVICTVTKDIIAEDADRLTCDNED